MLFCLPFEDIDYSRPVIKNLISTTFVGLDVIGSVQLNGSGYKELKVADGLAAVALSEDSLVWMTVSGNDNAHFQIFTSISKQTMFNCSPQLLICPFPLIDKTRLWYTDDQQQNKLWFEVGTEVISMKAVSKSSETGR